MKVSLDVTIPEGYEPTGEYRSPENDECYLSADGDARVSYGSYNQPRIMLRKKVWVPAAGETYYYLTNGGMNVSSTNATHVNMLVSGNYFKTRELAHQAAGAIFNLLKTLPKE